MAISRGQVFQQNPLMETIKQFGNQVNSMMRVYQNQQQIDLIRQKQEEQKRQAKATSYYEMMKHNADQHMYGWAGYLKEDKGQEMLRYYMNDLLELTPTATENYINSIPTADEYDLETEINGLQAWWVRNGPDSLSKELERSPTQYRVVKPEVREKVMEEQVQDVVEGPVQATTPETTERRVVPQGEQPMEQPEPEPVKPQGGGEPQILEGTNFQQPLWPSSPRKESVDAVTRAAEPGQPTPQQPEGLKKDVIIETRGGETYTLGEVEGNKFVIDQKSTALWGSEGGTYNNFVSQLLKSQGVPTTEANMERWKEDIYKLNGGSQSKDQFYSTLHKKSELRLPVGGVGSAVRKAQTTDSKAVNTTVNDAMGKVVEAATTLTNVMPDEAEFKQSLNAAVKPALKAGRVMRKLNIKPDQEEMIRRINRIVGGDTVQETFDRWQSYAYPNTQEVEQKKADAAYMNAVANMIRATSGTSPEQIELETAKVQRDIAYAGLEGKKLDNVIKGLTAAQKQFEVQTMAANPEQNPDLWQAGQSFKLVQEYMQEKGITQKEFERKWAQGKLEDPDIATHWQYYIEQFARYNEEWSIVLVDPKKTPSLWNRVFGSEPDTVGQSIPRLVPTNAVVGKEPVRGQEQEEEENSDAADQISRDFGL